MVSVGMGGGQSKSKSSSTVQNAEQRRNIFQGGVNDIGNALGQNTNNGAGQFALPDYQGATFTGAGPASRLGGGDYGRLENSIRESQWAPIDALKTQRFADIDQEMADRGLYTSGVGADTKESIFARDFLPAYQGAANQAVSTRYGLEQADNQAANAFNLNSANMANQFNMQDAAGRNQAAWAPLEYLLGLYNQTGGSNSTSKGSSWNTNMSGSIG